MQTPVRVGGPGWGECFADAVERADSADAWLRSALLSIPDDDPYSSYLHGMADSIHPLDPTEVPSAFRDGPLLLLLSLVRCLRFILLRCECQREALALGRHDRLLGHLPCRAFHRSLHVARRREQPPIASCIRVGLPLAGL